MTRRVSAGWRRTVDTLRNVSFHQKATFQFESPDTTAIPTAMLETSQTHSSIVTQLVVDSKVSRGHFRQTNERVLLGVFRIIHDDQNE